MSMALRRGFVLLPLLAFAAWIACAIRTPSAELAALETGAATRYGLSPALVEAVVSVESGGNPGAVSPENALGLMQVTRDKFRPGQNPFDQATNLDVGTRYLAGLIAHYHGNLELALAAYVAGPSAVARYRGVPPYPAAEAYVKAVLAKYRALDASAQHFVRE